MMSVDLKDIRCVVIVRHAKQDRIEKKTNYMFAVMQRANYLSYVHLLWFIWQ